MNILNTRYERIIIMFNFVKQDSLCDDYTPVTKEDISRVENKFSIVFPDILKEYYLNITECICIQ